jgi:hypothetical protein
MHSPWKVWPHFSAEMSSKVKALAQILQVPKLVVVDKEEMMLYKYNK